ncbi:MAG: terminase small subunit [Bacteroidia bacterium]
MQKIKNYNDMARPFKFTAKEILQKFEDYKIHRSKQFDVRYESIKSGDKAGQTYEVRLPKVLSITSFCLFIGVSEQSFFNWLNNESENIDIELFEVITRVQNEIKDYQLSGATNGIYNANIVARMNGLNESIAVSNDIQPSININIAGIDMKLDS